MILFPKGYLAMSRDIPNCHNWSGGRYYGVEDKDAAKHPIIYRPEPPT